MTNTSITNESEAMEVARNVLGRLLACKLANLDELRTEAEVARVIATALEARDAELASLRTMLEASRRNCRTRDDQIDARDARIRELEEVLEDMLGGDIDVSATALIYGDDLRDCLKEWRAILTKGNTHA